MHGPDAVSGAPDTDAGAGWEGPPRGGAPNKAASGTAAAAPLAVPVLSVDGFEGPLDWLLEMARAQKIDLARLSIGALVEAFAAALQAALATGDGAPLSRWGDWLVMAATLAWMRSRLLLPAGAPEARAAETEAEALRRQLFERAEMRAAADWLERRPQLGWAVFPRGAPEIVPAGRAGDITALLRACLVALRIPEQAAAAYRPRPPPFWRVPDAIARIRQLLGVLRDGSPLAAFVPAIDGAEPELRRRAAVASTLLAGLELARDGTLTLEQTEMWHWIEIRRVASSPSRA